MRARVIFKILLIIVLILLATPLLGALVMATGNSMILQMPDITNWRLLGLATIWIVLLLLLIVASIVSIVRSVRSKRGSERDKAA